MKKVLFLLGALFSFNAFAANLEEGKQYVQVSQTASAQSEVIEFFSFYCPHCYAFEMEYHIPKQVAEGLPQGTEFKHRVELPAGIFAHLTDELYESISC